MKCPICKNELEIKNKKVGETANGDSIFNEFAICHNCKKQWNLDKQRAKKAAEANAAAEEKPAKEEKEETVAPTDAPKKKRKKRPVSVDEAPKAQDEKEAVSPEEHPKKKKKRPVPTEAPAEVPEGEQPRPKKKKKRPVADTSIEETRPVKVKKAAHAMDESIDEFKDTLDVERPKPKKRKPIDNVKKEEPAFSNIPPKHIREEREKEMRQNYQLMLDEGEEDDRALPTVVIVILILLLLATAAFAGYWFFIR